ETAATGALRRAMPAMEARGRRAVHQGSKGANVEKPAAMSGRLPPVSRISQLKDSDDYTTHQAVNCGFLDDALTYRARGWSCVPIGANPKHPCIKWKPFADRLPSDDELRTWFTRPG